MGPVAPHLYLFVFGQRKKEGEEGRGEICGAHVPCLFRLLVERNEKIASLAIGYPLALKLPGLASGIWINRGNNRGSKHAVASACLADEENERKRARATVVVV